jgi:outer membrane receptor protein involved in Fe transport
MRLLMLICLFFTVKLQAQMPGGRSGAGAMAGQMNAGRLYGKILDAETGKPIEAASVQLTSTKFDEVKKKRKDTTISGQLTAMNGDFSLENLPVMGSFKLVITAVGYKTIEQKQSFDMSGMMGGGGDMTKMMNAVDKDLGNIKMEKNAAVLNDVTVTTVKRAIEMGIDKRIFNVDKNATTVGGTGLDVIKNIPNLTVDVDGNVQLRGSSPTIFVDGRPTTLTLEQIPAETIEKVELVTNPSSKYDASGVGGIINVVLKKNIRKGYNGFLSLGVGTYDRYNANFNFNYRMGKFNWFTNLGYNYSGNFTTGYTRRENLKGGITTGYYNVDQENASFGGFGFARFGFDFYADIRNTITLSVAASKGGFDTREEQTQNFLSAGKQVTSTGSRNSTSSNIFRGVTSQLSYKHNFSQPGREYTADVTYTNGGSDNDGDFNTILQAVGGTTQNFFQRNDGGGTTQQLTVQTDYVHPIGDNKKFEAGLRTNWNWFESPFISYTKNYGWLLVKNDFLSNNYNYVQAIHAAYMNYSISTTNKKWGFQFGLRTELSNFDGQLTQFNPRSQFVPGVAKDTSLKISIDVPSSTNGSFLDAFFPTAFVTYKISDNDDMQLNYSRRIQRPNFFQLIPFTDFSDLQNLRQGNGALRPEFTNSLEMNYNHKMKEGNLLVSSFYRATADPIVRFSVPFSRQSGAVLPNSQLFDTNTVVVNTFINAQSQSFLGTEFTFQYNLSKSINITPSANLSYADLKANYLGYQQNSNGWQVYAKLNGTVKFKNNWSVQLNSSYDGPRVTPQGRSVEVFFMDVAVKKDFMKGNAASLTLAVTDVFNQRGFGGNSSTDTWNQEFFRRRESRFARITFSYRFGKFDAQLFKRKNLKSERELMQGGQGMQDNN